MVTGSFENFAILERWLLCKNTFKFSNLLIHHTHCYSMLPLITPNRIYTHANNQQILKSGHLSNELDTLCSVVPMVSILSNNKYTSINNIDTLHSDNPLMFGNNDRCPGPTASLYYPQNYYKMTTSYCHIRYCYLLITTLLVVITIQSVTDTMCSFSLR